MNMLSKPVERCRKTSYSLNLSLVLSALNALYKLLEKFCCILSLKIHLQAIHISVQSAHGGEDVGVLPRVESGSVDRRAFLEQVRELGGGRLASAGRNVDRGMPDPQPPGLRQLHPRHAVLEHHVRSMDWTAVICEGWSSITSSAAVCGVSRWSASGSRIMGAPTIRSRGRGGSTASPGTSCSR